jgi:hypothetical protein
MARVVGSKKTVRSLLLMGVVLRHWQMVMHRTDDRLMKERDPRSRGDAPRGVHSSLRFNDLIFESYGSQGH